MLTRKSTDTSTSTATGRATDPWPAVLAAQAHDSAARLPFCIAHGDQALPVGSVARTHLDALTRWPQALRIDAQAVTLTLPPAERCAFFDEANRALHRQGLIRAWRDETYPVLSLPSPARPHPLLLASLERAASRFWGTLTFGAHCNGWVANAAGRPSHLWIARRALDKAVDPGLLDNLIGGGVPQGQTPAQTVVREGWEEAGLKPAHMQGLAAGRRFAVTRDVAEGLQREEVSVFDLRLPPDLLPCNQDGEVHSLQLLPIDQALAHAAAGEMTVDATLVTLDFALRYRLLALPHQHLQALCEPLWRGRASLDR